VHAAVLRPAHLAVVAAVPQSCDCHPVPRPGALRKSLFPHACRSLSHGCVWWQTLKIGVVYEDAVIKAELTLPTDADLAEVNKPPGQQPKAIYRVRLTATGHVVLRLRCYYAGVPAHVSVLP
jgi:hypothetical protein